MQGHGGHQIGVGDQIATRPHQPAAERRSGVGAVAVFEGKDQPPAERTIGHYRPSPLINRALTAAGAA